jgi:hypothetical protein
MNGRLTLEHVWARWLTKQLKAELFRVVTQNPSSPELTRFTKELDARRLQEVQRWLDERAGGGDEARTRADGDRPEPPDGIDLRPADVARDLGRQIGHSVRTSVAEANKIYMLNNGGTSAK